MKKIAVAAAAVLAFAIVLSGCQFNLFGVLDTIKIPSAGDLLTAASENAKGFVSDVQDYIDSGAVTEDNADDVVDALENVYTSQPDSETGQRAAVLAGEISITSDPETKQVVDGVIETAMDTLNAGGDIDPETLIRDIFPPDLTQAGLTSILDNLTQAADAYDSFGTHTAGADDWMSSSEIGDVTQYAVVSMAVADIRDQLTSSEGSKAAADAAILAAIQGGSLPVITNPFTTGSGTKYENGLTGILNLAGLDL